MKASRILNYLVIILGVCYIFLLINKPEISREGIASGIILCGKVIIPALFPFVMCVMLVVNSGVLNHIILPKFLRKYFSAELFFVIILSFIGGYPIGAKLLNSIVQKGEISGKTAGKMLNFCINAGPAFIVSAVGSGILGSKEIGVILLLSHILAGVMLMIISNPLKENPCAKGEINPFNLNPADNFVKSVADASGTVLGICSFVIFFSSVNAYIGHFSQTVSWIKPIGALLEITNAVCFTRNIYLISFLLGFGGISVWCQVLSVGSDIQINFTKFLIFRILHGTLSSGITAIFLKLLRPELSVFSNVENPVFSSFYSTAAVGFSLIILGIVFIISVSTKKYVGKITEDMI